MKNNYTIILFILFFFSQHSINGQSCIWARQEELYNYNRIIKCTLDDNGNAYMTGNFIYNAAFDSIQFQVSGDGDCYIAKYDPLGRTLWVIRNIGSSYTEPQAICNDKHGHLYMTGSMEDSVKFGSFTVVTTIGISSPFIVKLDTAGNIAWLKAFQSNFNTSSALYIKSICTDSTDNLFFTGDLHGTITYGNVSLNDSSGRLVVGKFDQNGSLLWIKQFKGANVNPFEIKIDPFSNILIGGEFGYYGFGGGTLIIGNDSFLTTGYIDVFACKLDSAGNPLWAKDFGTLGEDRFGNLNTDNLSNVYITNSYQDTMISYFSIEKLNANGQHIWNLKSNSNSYGYTSTTDDGISYSLIEYLDSLNLDSIHITNNTHFVPNTLLLRLDSSGHINWYKNIKAAISDHSDICCGIHGNILICQTNLFSGIKLGNNMLFNGLPGNYNNQYDGIALFTDSLFQVSSGTFIMGTVFNDIDTNCVFDPGETFLEGYSVVALPGPYFGTVGNSGNFIINSDSGNYSVQQVLPYNHGLIFSKDCPASGIQYVHLNLQDTLTGINFGGTLQNCSLFTIQYELDQGIIMCDLTQQRKINICNIGTDTAISPELKIQYPRRIIPVSASVPWTSYSIADSILTFNLSNIPPDSCIIITIIDSAICFSGMDTIAEYTWAAKISPINNCYTNDSIYNADTLIDYYQWPWHVYDNGNSPSINIYPNPAKDKIFISSKDLYGETTTRIMDLTGRELITKVCHFVGKTEIDVSSLTDGLFLINIISGKINLTKKIFIY